MDRIKDIIGAYYRGEIDQDTAQGRLAELGADALADFAMDAFNRGWVSRFNLGLDEDGNPAPAPVPFRRILRG